MTDPTPTSRAAEVLGEHYGLTYDGPMWTDGACWKCRCGHALPNVGVQEAFLLHIEHWSQALADAGLLREQEPAQGALTEAEREALAVGWPDFWQVHAAVQQIKADAYAAGLAARGGTAAAGDEGLRARVLALCGDNAWFADFGEPPNEDVLPGVRETDLLAALDATPAPTEDPAPAQDTLRAEGEDRRWSIGIDWLINNVNQNDFAEPLFAFVDGIITEAELRDESVGAEERNRRRAALAATTPEATGRDGGTAS